MTRQRLATCCEPGCPELTMEPYCQDHARARSREYAKKLVRKVPTSHYRTKAWLAKRRLVLRRDPFCARADCQELARDVDHIVAIQDGGTDDVSNLEGLCKRHHSQKTMRELRDRGDLPGRAS